MNETRVLDKMKSNLSTIHRLLYIHALTFREKLIQQKIIHYTYIQIFILLCSLLRIYYDYKLSKITHYFCHVSFKYPIYIIK